MKKIIFLLLIVLGVNLTFAQETPIADWLGQAEVEYAKCANAYNLAYKQYQNTANNKFWPAIIGEYNDLDSIRTALDSLSQLRDLESELNNLGGWNRVKFVLFGKKIKSSQQYIDMYLTAISSFQHFVPKDGSASNDATILNIEIISFPYDTDKMTGFHFRYRNRLTKNKK